jgi:hypothetical protein
METTQTQTITLEQLTNQVIDLIKGFNDEELIQLNNEYCESINAMDSTIYSNDPEFLEMAFGTNVDAVARAIFYGDYNYSHNWVRFNGYGNLETFNWFEVKDLCELVPTMAEYIVETFQDFSQFDEIDFHI